MQRRTADDWPPWDGRRSIALAEYSNQEADTTSNDATSLINEPTVVFAFLVSVLGLIFWLSELPRLKKFFEITPPVIYAYFVPTFAAARLVRAPLFFFATGSMASIGGAASAPVVAGVYHPALAPVGLLIAVAGYVLGIYAALGCAWILGQIG